MLRVDEVSVDYSGALALEAVSLRVDAGEVVGVIGNNGAGKTSLLKAISSMVASRGTITMEDQEISGLAAHEVPARGIAHVPEGRRLFPYLSVEENLSLGAYPRGEPEVEDFERIYALFPRLEERRRQRAGTLSGGEQQMAAIARALMLRPKLLMLDEPSLGLAPLIVRDLFDTMARVNRELSTTMLIVEQNANLALRIARRAFVLETGRFVFEGDAESVASDESVRRAYLGY